MNKINGYTEEEAKSLIDYIKEGKRKGKTLTWLFESYGLQRGRAKGSVRNYYYTLMKNEKKDERIVKLLDGSRLSVEKIKEFTKEETDEVLRNILTEKSKGFSVRRAIYNLASGDDKLMLRLQNKYRNTLKKEPQRIAALAADMGISEETAFSGRRGGVLNDTAVSISAGAGVREKRTHAVDKDFLRRRLENEINALYDRLAQALKTENERLRAENKLLKDKLQDVE